MEARFDHLVVACASLEQGAAWCESRLGIVPGPGGRHALMGTHNRLVSLADARHPRAYLELIAVDPEAPPPGRRRWFDLDVPALREAVREEPRLVHWVARVDDAERAAAVLRRLDLEPGPVIALERATPSGLLRWRLTVREDGRRLLGGALPTLIEWDGPHPVDRMPDSGVTLRELSLGAEGGALASALRGIGLEGVAVRAGAPALVATLDTPRGSVQLTSSP